jgi:hypothetical protein
MKCPNSTVRQHGLDLLAEPESFLVTKQNHPEPDETTRARAWGRQLAAKLRS